MGGAGLFLFAFLGFEFRGVVASDHHGFFLGGRRTAETLGGREGGKGGMNAHPAHAPAAQTGPGAEAGTQPRSDRSSFDPVRRTPAAVELVILDEEADVVAHTDPSRQLYVPVRKGRRSAPGLLLGEPEEVGDPLAGDADHRPGTSTPPAASGAGSGLRHAGHTTATFDISVLHRGQWTDRPSNARGIQSGGGGTGGGGTGGGGGGGPTRLGPTEAGHGSEGKLTAGNPACGTVLPQCRQKRAPGSATVPHRGQSVTSGQSICDI